MDFADDDGVQVMVMGQVISYTLCQLDAVYRRHDDPQKMPQQGLAERGWSPRR